MINKVKLWTAGAATVLLIALVLWWMNLGYAKVSDKGYQFAMAMTSICNQRDSARLAVISAQIRASSDASELPEYDSRVLLGIAQRAEVGEWKTASELIRRLMEDQVEQ